jgi:hypothetical protein
MSNIALTPDASGTGTFTLASPNSNTNRTLTLPDTSGIMFNQGNIVGTVSQSAGVPTGGIIESGSNANGEFTKFADGTMICRFTVTTSAAGATTKTLPATFISTGYIAVGGSMSSAGASDITAKFSSASTTTIGVVLTNNGVLGAGTATCIAIGQWF